MNQSLVAVWARDAMAQTGHADFSRPAVIFARQVLGIRAAIKLPADIAPYKPGRQLVLGFEVGGQYGLADQRYER